MAAAATDNPETLIAIQNISPESVTNLADDTEARSIGEEFTIPGDVNGASITLPTDPEDSLVLRNNSQSNLEVVLPIESPVIDDTSNVTPVYSAGTDAELVPIVKDDGSVQVTTVLGNAQAPTRYDYTFAEGTRLQLTEDGYVILTDESGNYSGGVMPAWAIDSNGADVPTRFEVNGTVLTQIVEHAGASYPVVADPYMGKALISSVEIGSEKGEPRYSVKKLRGETRWHWATALGDKKIRSLVQ